MSGRVCAARSEQRMKKTQNTSEAHAIVRYSDTDICINERRKSRIAEKRTKMRTTHGYSSPNIEWQSLLVWRESSILRFVCPQAKAQNEKRNPAKEIYSFCVPFSSSGTYFTRERICAQWTTNTVPNASVVCTRMCVKCSQFRVCQSAASACYPWTKRNCVWCVLQQGMRVVLMYACASSAPRERDMHQA